MKRIIGMNENFYNKRSTFVYLRSELKVSKFHSWNLSTDLLLELCLLFLLFDEYRFCIIN